MPPSIPNTKDEPSREKNTYALIRVRELSPVSKLKKRKKPSQYTSIS